VSFKFPEKYRLRKGAFASDPAVDGNNGAGFIPFRPGQPPLKFIASDGSDLVAGERWEHVSVSLPHRCPTWEEMCFVKSLFWDDEDPVMQLHPPRSTWVNNHQFCLHMWRPVDAAVPLPPEWMVGYRELGVVHG
jgi:hypothetical protein